MARRYDPAMRTCQAAERRLGALSTRASRIADLLCAPASMSRSRRRTSAFSNRWTGAPRCSSACRRRSRGSRSVAISYYAVSLASYLLSPFAPAVGLDKTGLTAAIAIPVILAVWAFVRRVRRQLEKSDGA